MKKTPIQKAIDDLTEINSTLKNHDHKAGILYAIDWLKSLLPYEKQFMQGVFEKGENRENNEHFGKVPNRSPDFETLYSRFNQ